MYLYYSQCNGFGEGLFEDIVKYKFIDQYLQAVVDVLSGRVAYRSADCPKFVPMSCGIIDPKTAQLRLFVTDGRLVSDIDAQLRWIQSQPSFVRRFVTDYTVIRVDGVKREVFIRWDRWDMSGSE